MSQEQQQSHYGIIGGRCNGICSRYASKQGGGQKAIYAQGIKRCQICEIYLQWDDIRCPCCHYILRTKPRSGKYKEKYRKAMSKKQQQLTKK